ncbi:MAG: cyclase family protein [Thermoprotei archaeon]|nr:MAG: cyclase family protein [Thermoprotei archaeon]
MVKVVDLTLEIRDGMQVFPLYVPPTIRSWTRLELHGFSSNLLLMVEHTGTHVDAPAHFIHGGATIEKLDLGKFFGDCIVLDVRYKGVKEYITKRDVEELLKRYGITSLRDWIVLFCTGWSRRVGSPEYLTSHPAPDADCAKYLVELGVKAVGIDAPSIDHPESIEFPVHKILLSNGVVVYENLVNLEVLCGRRCKFFGVPLKIVGGTASPVRAFAIVEE